MNFRIIKAWITPVAMILAAIIGGVFGLYQGWYTVQLPSQLPPAKADSDKSALFSPSNVSIQESYVVILLVPSYMSNADIFVDDKPAKIIKNLATQKKILVKKKDSNHSIILKKNERHCSKQVYIYEDNQAITLCD